jgi:histidinol-phosphate aminotransferase
MPHLRARLNLPYCARYRLGLAGIRLKIVQRSRVDRGNRKLRPPYNVNVLSLAAADLMLEHLATLDSQAVMLCESGRAVDDCRARSAAHRFPVGSQLPLFRVADPGPGFGAEGAGHPIKNVSTTHPLLAGCLRTTIEHRGKMTR